MNSLSAQYKTKFEQDDRLNDLSLSNRPALDVDLEYIDAVAADLAINNARRADFIDDPAGYLSRHDMPVSDCKLVAADVGSTSEVAAVFVVAAVVGYVYAAGWFRVVSVTQTCGRLSRACSWGQDGSKIASLPFKNFGAL